MNTGNMEILPPSFFEEVYKRLSGSLDICSSMWNTGRCFCCVPQSEMYVLHLLPGEYDYLTDAGVALEQRFNSKLMAACNYNVTEGETCPCKPFICRLYPVLILGIRRRAVRRITLDHDCSAVARYGYTECLSMESMQRHVRKVVDTVNWMLLQNRTTEEWFINLMS